MSDPAVRLGLVLHPRRDNRAVAARICAWARSHSAEVLVQESDATRGVDAARVVSTGEFVASVDAVVSLGGDGTMLGALRLMVERPVPVVGVNTGQLGFLVEVQPADLDAALDRIEREDFEIEGLPCVTADTGHEQLVAFNDIALARVPGDGALQATLAVGGRGHGRYRCDALIVATPIGSTAYSYAAGGPVISPRAEVLVISAAAPMQGISRPIVVAADEPLRLEVLPDSGSPVLERDGAVVRALAPGEHVELRSRADAGHVVRLDAARFEQRNRVKLSLLDLPYLPEEMRELAEGSPFSEP